jgi:hypothetical protein
MLKKIKLGLVALLLPLLAFGQTYPSPTFQNLTVNGTLTAANQSFTNPLPVASGGTNCATASGTCLDNITGFASTGFLTRTGAGTYAFQSLTNGITYANLAQAGANTLLGNATGSTANVTAITVTGCNGAAQALQWTNGSGFGCNSSVATSGANANITSLSGLSTPLSVGQGGTGRATLTSHAVLVGAGTSAVTQIAPCAAGQALIGAGASSDPACGLPTGTLINVQVFTSSGTYTATSGTKSVIVDAVGGGGGGGGNSATGAGQSGAGNGGSGGSFARILVSSGFSGATVTIGAAGTTGAGAAGGPGGTTSFGTFLSCPGGLGGGAGGATSAAVVGSSTLSPSACTIAGATTIFSSPGYAAKTGPAVITAGTQQYSSPGGDSPFGAGGPAVVGNSTANPGLGHGSGGGGACLGASQAAVAGGAATTGLVIVYEYD